MFKAFSLPVSTAENRSIETFLTEKPDEFFGVALEAKMFQVVSRACFWKREAGSRSARQPLRNLRVHVGQSGGVLLS